MSERSQDIVRVLLWLLASTIAMVLAMNLDSASFVDGEYIPVGNDSFYHARRILDAAIGERGFYQFDDLIHVPEGSWITWPWAYDWLMAMTLATSLRLDPGIEPMAFLAHVPVAWVFVNAGLFMMICRKMDLALEFTAMAMLGFCLLPLTQALHGLGIVDHHFIELTFMLAAVWLGLGYYDGQAKFSSALGFGLILAVAPAFHNGLFILQLPGLAISFVFWFRERPGDSVHARTFCIALLAGTVAVLLPSGPFIDLQFEFSTLSWFHLYIAYCTAVCTYYMSMTSSDALRRKLPRFLMLIAVLALPLLVKVGQGAAFIAGSTILLDQVSEVRSPLRMYFNANNSLAVTRYYSWLIVLSPVVLLAYMIRLAGTRDARQLSFAVFVVFGILLLLTQYRLHPFGFWALIIAPLVLVDELIDRFRWNRVAIAAFCLAATAVAFQPPLKHQLFEIFPAGLTKDYAASRSMFPILRRVCNADPGIALAYSDDGHPIRYHTECSVIANNFLLTKQHGEKITEANRLLNMTPEQLLDADPQVNYIFVRLYQLFQSSPDGFTPTPVDELRKVNAPLFSDLVFRSDLPKRFELLAELRVEDDRDFAFIRVFRIQR